MYNACTIIYIHIRSQASDWNCCVKRLFVCAQQSTSLIVHIRERERERERETDRYTDRSGEREIWWEREKDRNTDRIGEREKDSSTDRNEGIKRKRHGGIERKIETQTGVGREKERDMVGERKIDAPTGEARETWWFYLFLPHHIFLSPHSCMCFYLSLSLLSYFSQLCFNFEQLPN